MANDRDTISNEQHELEHVAKKFQISVEEVLAAKREAGTDDRKAVENKILENLGF